MKQFYIIVIFTCIFSINVMGQFHNDYYIASLKTTDNSEMFNDTILISNYNKAHAIIFWILGSPVGLHRIYFGTDPIIPVIYALTLGGGFGLLPVIDLVAIIASKDLSNFINNKEIFMWKTNEGKGEREKYEQRD